MLPGPNGGVEWAPNAVQRTDTVLHNKQLPQQA